jgi:uncharacterized membrane protein
MNLIVSISFGVAALLIVATNFSVPIPGTNYLTDPREIFTTIGAALSGPIGAVIIGVFAGIAVPGGVALVSIFAHVLGCLVIALSYRYIVFPKDRFLIFQINWIGVVLIYYYAVLIPIFVAGLKLINHDPNEYTIIYARLAQGAFPEVILTSIVTALILYALPKRSRKPLW